MPFRASFVIHTKLVKSVIILKEVLVNLVSARFVLLVNCNLPYSFEK